jgi:cell division protein ZapB
MACRPWFRLTSNRLPNYSGGMISEFHELAEKIDRLAEMANTLRRENAALRMHTATLEAENSELSRRMLEAQRRIGALLEKLAAPATQADEETA